MKFKQIIFMTYIIVLSLLMSSCGSGPLFGPTTTPTSTSTPTPVPTATNTSTPTPPPMTPTPEPIGEIQTSKGTAVIVSVERNSAWPAGCDPSVNFGGANACFIVANSGYELVIVYFTLKDSPEETLDVPLEANISVAGDDDQRYDLGSVGHNGPEQFVMFSVPVDVTALELYWEDNSPISLPQN